MLTMCTGQAFDGRREGATSAGTAGEDGCEAGREGEGTGEGRQGERCYPPKGRQGMSNLSNSLPHRLTCPTISQDLNKIREELKVKEAQKEAEAKRRGEYSSFVY